MGKIGLRGSAVPVGCVRTPLVRNKSMANYTSECGTAITHLLCFQAV